MPALVAIALLAMPAALAAKPSALLRCDGLGRRPQAGAGLARVPALLRDLGLLGPGEADAPRARRDGAEGLAACERALRDARVRGDPVRRAEVLLMRGIRRLENGDTAGAFDDGAAALAVPVRPREAPGFARTVAVSARLLQAHARLAAGQGEAAAALALAAAAARPFAPFVTSEALRIVAAAPAAALQDRAGRLNPRPAPLFPLLPIGRGRLATMALAWPRWEDGAVITGLGRDIARRPASVSLDAGSDGATRLRLRRPAFIDSQFEAALLLAARTARARGADRLAIVDRGTVPGLGRAGLVSEFLRLEFVMPGDAQWERHAARALPVAEIESSLAPVFDGVR